MLGRSRSSKRPIPRPGKSILLACYGGIVLSAAVGVNTPATATVTMHAPMRCMHAHPIPRNLLPSLLGALRPDDAAVVVDSQVIILGSARCAYAHEQRRRRRRRRIHLNTSPRGKNTCSRCVAVVLIIRVVEVGGETNEGRRWLPLLVAGRSGGAGMIHLCIPHLQPRVSWIETLRFFLSHRARTSSSDRRIARTVSQCPKNAYLSRGSLRRPLYGFFRARNASSKDDIKDVVVVAVFARILFVKAPCLVCSTRACLPGRVGEIVVVHFFSIRHCSRLNAEIRTIPSLAMSPFFE